MGDSQKAYTNAEITVIWTPASCLHSGKCVKGLGEVFSVKARPWINLGVAKTERIIEQVEQCPSGALAYIRHEKIAKVAG